MSNHQHNEADALMASISNGPSLTKSLVIAFVIHLVLIGVSSIPYLLKASSYGTLNVRDAAQQERLAAEEEARAQRIAERKAEREDAAKALPKPAAKPKDTKPERVEPSKGEVIRERPTESGINIDEDFGL